LAHSKLADGSAWKVFQELVSLQGGNLSQILQPSTLPEAPSRTTWKAKKRGFIGNMNTENLGRILIELGGGRKQATDPVDHGVGLIFHKKLGNKVQVGEPLVTVYANRETDLGPLEALFQQSVEIKSTRQPVPKLIFEHF
jgi:pyrimidine-nucleoside phosphorylase